MCLAIVYLQGFIGDHLISQGLENPLAMYRIRFVPLLLLLLSVFACQREDQKEEVTYAPFLSQKSNWADSVLANMTTTEKIGQLLFVSLREPQQHTLDLLKQDVFSSRIGGLKAEGLNSEHYISWKDSLDRESSLPLFWGTRAQTLLNEHFTDTEALPSFAALQAIENDTLRTYIETLHRQQLQSLAMNWTILPDAQEHPIRSNRLADRVSDRMIGLGAWPNQKALYQLNDPEDADLSFYSKEVRNGLSGLLVDWAPFLRDSLEVQSDFLRHKLKKLTGFDGLVIAPTHAAVDPVEWLNLGADQLIVGEEWRQVREELLQAVEAGQLSTRSLNRKVHRLLLAKKWTEKPQKKKLQKPDLPIAQASFKPPLSEKNDYVPKSVSKVLKEHFNDPNWILVKRSLYEQSIILANNRDGVLPIDQIRKKKFRISQYSDRSFFDFREQFRHYADYRSHLVRPAEDGSLPAFPNKAKTGWVNVVLLDKTILPQRDDAFIQSLLEVGKTQPLVLINFGSAHNLAVFDTSLTILQIYERNDLTEEMAAQVLFGALGTNGKLPETINSFFKAGTGVKTPSTRLAYGIPQEVGISPKKLVGIDAIMNTAVDKNVIPGGQILVAQKGKVVYSKAFGYHTFKKRQAVQENDLYDLASVTKVAATTLAMMQMHDLNKVELNDRLKEHLDLASGATIKNIPVKKLLTHQSGLQPNMPIAPYLLFRDIPNAECDKYFCKETRDTFGVQVAENFYFQQRYLDTIWWDMQHLPLRSQSYFRYSDVNFMLVQRLVEKHTGVSLDKWVDRKFYGPLGLRHSTYNPLKKFKEERIVPTQNDKRWRKQLLRGYVHDETAALNGGVGGSAGLFSNAEDLAVIFQLLLNKGVYGGKRYFNAKTVELFSSASHGNHRGLGFDKPGRKTKYPAYSEAASLQTFGHTGFTGTCVWADPEHDLIYIFLTNRVYPNGRNREFFRSNIRRRIHDVIYEALDTFDPQLPSLPENKSLVLGAG